MSLSELYFIKINNEYKISFKNSKENKSIFKCYYPKYKLNEFMKKIYIYIDNNYDIRNISWNIENDSKYKLQGFLWVFGWFSWGG